MNSPLNWDVFISSQIPAVTGDLPPGATEMKWSPISSTLISGERDAVLVDTFITVEQNRALLEWVAASEKNLTAIISAAMACLVSISSAMVTLPITVLLVGFTRSAP